VPDAIFDDPRLAAVYDALDPDRSDLDGYARILDGLGARSVLDVGCGTGTFAVLLAARGLAVTGVDPARASLDVARRKPFADRVTWLYGDATTLPPLQVDAAVMTANVAQVFLDDAAWAATLAGIRAALRPGGTLVFEARRPERRAWLRWTPEATFTRVVTADHGVVESWEDVTGVDGELVTFTSMTRFADTGVEIASTSTLRFRPREDIERSLADAGYLLDDVRDAPDRPGAEWVYVARRPDR
jgi:SAM-dependent methyltransferase